jgi:hypothetical protein
MRTLNPDELRAYLRAEQVASAQIENVVDAFDFRVPVYEATLESGQELFQYLRKPSSSAPSPRVGNWFCLRGATRDGLAIIGGGSGRVLHRHVVALDFRAIEGTARAQRVDWRWDGGGAGGATQIYVPQRLLGRLAASGPHEPW